MKLCGYMKNKLTTPAGVVENRMRAENPAKNEIRTESRSMEAMG